MSVVVKGNRVSGGTARERLVAAMEASRKESASGIRRSFYSMTGYWTVKYGITGEPWGYRSDCSQWFTSMYWSAGLPDPNGNSYTGGFTGTLGAQGIPIREEQLEAGDAILYGPYPHHHVEMFRGSYPRTVGHGTPPVDYGTVHQFGPPVAGTRSEVHCRRYIADMPELVQFTRNERQTLGLLMTERARASNGARRSLIRRCKARLLVYRAAIRAAAALSGWSHLDRRRRYQGLLDVYNGGTVRL